MVGIGVVGEMCGCELECAGVGSNVRVPWAMDSLDTRNWKRAQVCPAYTVEKEQNT